MSKRVVIDTSTGGLDYYKEPHDIEILRIKIFLDDKGYSDGKDLKAETFYDILREKPDLVPKTSQPSLGEVIDFFKRLHEEKGYDEFFVTTISSKLSGTYNTVVLAAQQLEPEIKVHAFDTLTVCFSEGLFALEAEKMIKAGASFEEVETKLLDMRKKNTIFFAVDSLSYLVKNGRLSGAAAFVGKLLKIKPILQVQETGHIVSIEKIRNIKMALSSIAKKVDAYTHGHAYEAYILYTGNPTLKAHFEHVLKQELGLEHLYEAPNTPVVGAHIGPDVVGVGIFLK